MARLKVPNYLPLGALMLLAGWIVWSCLRHFPHPPVGTSIGVLAFVAAVVTIWPPDNAWAKAGWLIVFGAFLVLEITTLYQQRADDRQADYEKRKTEDDRFAGLLKTQQDDFAHVLAQNQREFDASMGEVRGSSGYVFFLALAREAGDLPVLMENDNKTPVRGVDLEIITIPPKGPDELIQFARSVFNPRLVHIGDVSPGFKTAPFILNPGSYNIRIITRLAVFNEYVEVIRGPSVANGWRETSCIMKNNSNKVLKGECPSFMGP